jgi:hypothetical protein
VLQTSAHLQLLSQHLPHRRELTVCLRAADGMAEPQWPSRLTVLEIGIIALDEMPLEVNFEGASSLSMIGQSIAHLVQLPCLNSLVLDEHTSARCPRWYPFWNRW